MPEYKISSGLPSYPSGLTDKEASIVLPLYRAINSLTQVVSTLAGETQLSQVELANLDSFIGLTSAKNSVITVKAAVAIGYGNLLSITESGTGLLANLASYAAPTTYALAICDQPGGIAAGAYGKALWMQGKTKGISGTTFGAQYWLSTAGVVQITKPTTAGNVAQQVGIGLAQYGFYLNIPNTGVIV